MSVQEKIKQIHSEFKQALDSSSLKVNEVSNLTEVQNAHKRLSDIGLTNSETFKKFEKELQEKNIISAANLMTKQIRIIETQFPEYRLIGLKKLLEICNKYNLVVSESKNFTGIVPNKNLSEIEEHRTKICSSKAEISIMDSYHTRDDIFGSLISGSYKVGNNPLYFIAAPQKDFKSGMTNIGGILYNIEKPGFKFNTKIRLVTPDPIVLSPVDIKGAIIFQIVTAWGIEADDDYVTNKVKIEINNN
jgi:hypothetical protein